MSNIDLFFDWYLNHIIKEFDLVKQSEKTKWTINSRDKAFEIFSISTFLWKTFSEVYTNINTWWLADENYSSNDWWFDWIFIEESWNDSYILHIFQCKNQSSLSPKEINDFVYDVDLVFLKWETNSKPLNKKTKWLIDNYKSLKSKYIEKRLYFIYNWDYSENSNDFKLKEQYEINNSKRDDYKILIFDKNDIYNEIWKLLKDWKRKKLNFTFDIDKSNISYGEDIQSLISYWIAWAQSFVFKISALEICRMIEEEEKLNLTFEYLYSKNIRWFLWYRAKPNKKMKETISDKTEVSKFFLYNNGLTIICDSLKVPTLNNWRYNFSIENPLIVNWLQTSQVLYEEYKNDKSKLNNVFVLIRLCQTTDETIVKKITETTNNQSVINFTDQLSNEDYNLFARELFKTNWINYITKRGDIFREESILSNMKDVKNDTLLKFWFATFFEKPTIAKNSIRKVTEVIFNANSDETELSFLFEWWKNAKILKQLLETFYIYDFIINERNNSSINEEYSDFILNADELISYWIYKLLTKENLEINTKNVSLKYKEVYSAIFEIVKNEIKSKISSNSTYSHNNYFKNIKCKFDLDNKMSFVDNDDEQIINNLRLK